MAEKNRGFVSALVLGILSSIFFAMNFILNRSMSLGGGYFLWAAVLRYGFTLPLTAIMLFATKGFAPVFDSIRNKPLQWLLWSTVGFGLFYAPLCMAASFGESWFTAALWQFTIVAGILLTPLFGKKIPKKNLACSFIMIAGIFLLQYTKLISGVKANWGMLLLTMGIAAVSYPLGNRKVMQITDGDNLTTLQRVFGMTLCSMPFWIVCGFISYSQAGIPSQSQVFQSFLVALISGVIATLLFFEATRRVQFDARKLAIVEATQSGEVIFSLLFGVLLLKDAAPGGMGYLGIVVILAGMLLNCLV